MMTCSMNIEHSGVVVKRGWIGDMGAGAAGGGKQSLSCVYGGWVVEFVLMGFT